MVNWILRWVASGVALAIVAWLLPHDISYGGKIGALVQATIAIGLVNSLVRPVLRFLTAPLNCITLGLSGVLINALLFWAIQFVVPGFRVTSILGAIVGPILMGLIGGVLGLLIPDEKRRDRR